MNEEQLKNNIKAISTLLGITSFLLIFCLFLNYFVTPKEDEEVTNEEIIETTQTESLGNIEEIEDPISERHPAKIYSNNKKIVGTTALNLFQFNANETFFRGLVASDNIYLAYTKYNQHTNSYDLLLKNKIKNTETTIINNTNAHFLHVYEGFIIGVFDLNYQQGFSNDCIFLYNIEKDMLTKYELDIMPIGQKITSFLFDGEQFYFTEKSSKYIYSLSIDGKKLSSIASIKQESPSDFAIITNIEDNIIHISTSYRKYLYDLKKSQLKEVEAKSLMPEITYNGYPVYILPKDDVLQILINDNIIYEGNISTLNKDTKIYFSEGNKLYFYDSEKIKLFAETQNYIEQIYLDEFNIILITKGEKYEIFSRAINNNKQ